MDGFGAYFGDNSIDTIIKYTIPLTYITPRVKTCRQCDKGYAELGAITGTFVATKRQKYALLGNF